MKASKKWLNEYVECLDIDIKEMEKAFTMSGTKVEQIEEIGKYNNIVIGKILEIKKGNLRGVPSYGMMCSCSELNIPLNLIGNQVENRNNDIRK